jgi:radical SAM-linked protein
MQRLRVKFSRGEEVKFISHLDIMRLWERALIRAGIKIAYSEGFSPHPRLSLAAPLAVGITSETELLDVFLTGTVSPHWFTDAVRSQLPPGIDITAVQQAGIMLPSLQSQVRMAEYTVNAEANDGPEDIGLAINRLMAAESLPWSHRRDTGRREYDLRPLIDDISLVSTENGMHKMFMRLRCDSSGSGRPEQVMLVLGFHSYPRSIHRTRLIFGS